LNWRQNAIDPSKDIEIVQRLVARLIASESLNIVELAKDELSNPAEVGLLAVVDRGEI
jgi:hypothetical protein